MAEKHAEMLNKQREALCKDVDYGALTDALKAAGALTEQQRAEYAKLPDNEAKVSVQRYVV